MNNQKNREVYVLSFNKKAELKALLSEQAQHVEDSFEPIEPRNSVRAIRKYFVMLRLADAYGCLSAQELENGLSFWVNSKEKVFEISPRDALDISYHAFISCGIGHINKPCSPVIVNSVCASVNVDIPHAVRQHRQSELFFLASASGLYLDMVESVLRTLAPHSDSPDLMTTFFEALTVWENLLFSELVSPSTRFKRVDELEANAKKSTHPCPQLLKRCGEIKKDAVLTKAGIPLLLNALEEDADAITEATSRAKPRLLTLFTGHAIRADEASQYATLFHDIEQSMQEGRYQETEDKCFELFQTLSKSGEDTPTLSYLMATAKKLGERNIYHGSNLAYRCILAIENENLSSESLQMTVYDFSLPIISKMDGMDPEYSAVAKELYKTIMKRSSEFQNANSGGEIFEIAAGCYRQFLGSIHPIQRYDELMGLYTWLRQREAASELLQEFTDNLLNSSQKYGNFDGIPFEKDCRSVATFHDMTSQPR
jgi:hypothetical protein